jgi:uncharacterized membrane protein
MLPDRRKALTGLGLGAGLMYFLSPKRGRRRRALVRDKLARTVHISADAVGTTVRNLAHRASGTVAQMRSALRRRPVDDAALDDAALDDAALDDAVLIDRVRTQLRRVVSHPHAITIDASNRRVTLSGPILQAEVDQLIHAVERVPGADEVVNALEEHKEPGSVPALQGGRTPRPPQPIMWRRQWAPTTRLLVGTAGTALAGYGASRRDVRGAILAATGVGLIARAATNLETRRLIGIGARRRAVDLQKTITINAPVEDVFKFWTAYENFPRFMSRVLDVRPSSRERQSHWKVAGPAGVPVEFDAEVSSFVPNKAFGWRTREGAPVAHAGLVRFDSTDNGRTRVRIRMSYNPPGGWWGHGVAAAFGVDPKTSLDADLVRMKTLLENVRRARDAAPQKVH